MTEGPSDVTAESAARLRRLVERLRQVGPGVSLELAPPARAWPETYIWIPEDVARANESLRRDAPGALPDYNRYVLLKLIERFSPRENRYRLPDSIAALYPAELARIRRQVETFEDKYFDTANDAFRKDLAILTHRLIPVGAEYAEGGAGIPRRLFFCGGIGQALRLLWLVLGRCRGRRPFFALHAHTLALADFNPRGWRATYHRLAELLELNPRMKGWVSASWFLDPALEDVSPHLGYLRKVPLEGGAALLFVCRHPDGSSGALSKSETRRRLFAEGKYVPATYMRIWPRAAVLAWRERQSRNPA